MPSILARFSQQSTETIDYDIDYTDWFAERTDTAASYTATAATGITLVTSSRSGNVVKVVLTGGTHGATYKITVRMTTSTSVVKEADFTVKIKDV